MGMFDQFDNIILGRRVLEPEMADPLVGPAEPDADEIMRLHAPPGSLTPPPRGQTTANAVKKSLAAVMGGIMPGPYKAYPARPPAELYSSSGGGLQSQVDARNARQKMREMQIMLMLNGMGTSQRNRIVSEGRRQTAAATQGALNRGMGASSILGGIQRAGWTATSDRLSALADMLAGRKVSFLNSITEDKPPTSEFLRNAENIAYQKGLANAPRQAPYQGQAPYNTANGPQPGMAGWKSAEEAIGEANNWGNIRTMMNKLGYPDVQIAKPWSSR